MPRRGRIGVSAARGRRGRRVTSAARRNIYKAQVSRIGIREPRSIGRMMRKKLRGSTIRRR